MSLTVLIFVFFIIISLLFVASRLIAAQRRRVRDLNLNLDKTSDELTTLRLNHEDLRVSEMHYREGFARDITERKQAESALKRQTAILELHQSIGEAASEAATFEDALQRCLEMMCREMSFPIGHVLLLAENKTNELVSAKLWHLDEPQRFEDFKIISEASCFKFGTDLPGRVLESGAALWLKDGIHNSDSPRADVASEIGICAGFAFPLLIDREVAGVVEFFSMETIDTDETTLDVLTHLGTQLGRILERELAERRLRVSEERYALAARGANDGLWDWDVRGNEIFYSSRWKAMIGCDESEIGDNPQEWFSRVHLEDIDMLRVKLTAHLDGHSAHFESEYRLLHRQGSYHWMLARGVAVRDASGSATRLAGSQTDITERKRVEEQMQHDALHDALTGLPNRPLFMDRLRLALERAHRDEGYRFAVFYCDFDRFKNINDGLGHTVADRLLVLVAARIKKLLRAGDTLARMNGDEFVVLLNGIEDVSEPIRIAERIERALEHPFIINEHEVFTTISVGIALSSNGYQQPQEILRDADAAMHRAKAAGRARYEVFDEKMHTRAVERLHLETDLRRAVERKELRVYYQPIMNLTTNELHGFEALVRWQHPKRGFLQPSEFISLAEESGLIVSVGLWVLKEACRQMNEWHKSVDSDNPLIISVNLATKQLQHAEIIKQVAGVLHTTGIKPCAVKLEITESGMMENTEKVVGTLNDLKSLGVNLSIDDFGTGYSSLSYLHRFPLNTLKIDRSFVSGLGMGDENGQIINTIISLAHNLRMETIAEGIETKEQLEQLKELNCAYGQGYFFARPLSIEAATQFIRARNPEALPETFAEQALELDLPGSASPLVH